MADAPDVLKRIVAKKRQEIEFNKNVKSETGIERDARERTDPPRGFVDAIKRSASGGRTSVIAEIKKASPSKGVIRENFIPPDIAESYAAAGATCLSVLTDESFFQGSNDYLIQARGACDLPVLRKDFTVDPYQVFEAASIGADCILLIAAILDLHELHSLSDLARDVDLDVLFEVHNQAELDNVLELEPTLIGINNRNLHTFEVMLDTTLDLLGSIPGGTLVISESGISSKEEVLRLSDAGVAGFLVGESFMREDDPGEKLRELFS